MEDKSKLLYNIMKYYNIKKFIYDGYLVISIFELLLSIIIINIWLSEVGKIFSQR